MVTTTNADESNELAKVTAQLLTGAAAHDRSRFSFEDGRVITNGQIIDVVPVSENALEHKGKLISAARFEISVNGASPPELTFGAIGIGDSRLDARRTAVAEWYMAAGEALISAIGNQPTETRIEGFSIYAGHMGLRGERPEGWLDGTAKMHQQILGSLTDHLPAGNADFHSIDIKITVEPNGFPRGQCLLDGKESTAAMQGLKACPWPTGESGYLFKQAFVMARE